MYVGDVIQIQNQRTCRATNQSLWFFHDATWRLAISQWLLQSVLEITRIQRYPKPPHLTVVAQNGWQTHNKSRQVGPRVSHESRRLLAVIHGEAHTALRRWWWVTNMLHSARFRPLTSNQSQEGRKSYGRNRGRSRFSIRLELIACVCLFSWWDYIARYLCKHWRSDNKDRAKPSGTNFKFVQDSIQAQVFT